MFILSCSSDILERNLGITWALLIQSFVLEEIVRLYSKENTKYEMDSDKNS